MLVAATLTDQVATLVVGFALTTVVGGVLGSWFQRRTWDHQNERTLAEADRNHATQTCRELSQLMDKRLYRMWQVKWALFDSELDQSRIDRRMDEYRAILVEWNDTLNRNLAAAQIEFGAALRCHLEDEIYERFAAVGRRLEARYRKVRSSRSGSEASGSADSKTLSRDLLRLRDQVYALNVRMLQQIRDGRIGRTAPD